MLRVRELDWRARIGDSSSAGKPSAWGNLNQEIPQVADDSSYETVVGSAPKVTASRRDLLAHCARSAEAHRSASDLPVHHTCIIPCYHVGGRARSALDSAAKFYVGLARLALGCILESGSTSPSSSIACPFFAAFCHVDTGRQSALEITLLLRQSTCRWKTVRMHTASTRGVPPIAGTF